MRFVSTEIFQTSKNSVTDPPAKEMISLVLTVFSLCGSNYSGF